MNSVMKIYNTLSRKKEELKTINEKELKIYVCGITPYDTTHLGHAFTYIYFDLLIRFLKYKNYKITYTQNVTDINDRDNDILKKAKEQDKSWQDLSSFWTEKFLNDMNYLNWLKPTNYLYASKQIDNMINLINKLIENKKAYLVNGSVYLDINKSKDYGKLSRLNKKEMLKLAKDFEEDIENKEKKNPLDITIWRMRDKNQKQHIPYFDSPFGQGRPGWHIECSAMAISSLGEQIDIHGGGRDLMFPHHEAEIVQSEGATNKIPFSRYWMHTGQVGYKGEKMSKSLGNLIMISDLSEKYSANTIRFMLLSNHYRKDWEYKDELIESANERMEAIEYYLSKENLKGKDLNLEIERYIADDLNTPKALDMIYKNIKNIDTKKTKKLLEALGFVF